MDKTTQDLVWACLPKEVRNHIRSDYEYYLKRYEEVNANTAKGAIDALEDLFGQHNLTSDTEPEKMLMVERKKVQEYKAYIDSIINGDFSSEFKKGHCYGQQTALDRLFGDKCLSDQLEHRLEQTSVQVEPKFKVGDIVRVKYPKIYKGEIGIIDEIGSRIIEYHLQGNKTLENVCFAEDALEPYTEPETKDMEEKELNLCELLKGCEGEEFYTPLCGNITFSHIESNTSYPILCYKGDKNVCFTLDGNFYNDYIGKCLIYPSRALYEKYPLDAKKAWDEWSQDRKPKRWTPQIGERIFWVNSHGTVSQDVCRSDIEGNGHQLKRRVIGNEFKTGKEAEQAAEAVKDTLMKFHEKISAQNLHNPK